MYMKLTHKKDLDKIYAHEEALAAVAQGASFTKQLMALKVGETLTKTKRHETPVEKEEIAQTTTRLRNSVASNIRRAQASGFAYTAEACVMFTTSLDVLCIMAITRTD